MQAFALQPEWTLKPFKGLWVIHLSPATMDTYAHLSPGSYANALERMEGMLSEGSKVVSFPVQERESA